MCNFITTTPLCTFKTLNKTRLIFTLKNQAKPRGNITKKMTYLPILRAQTTLKTNKKLI